MRRTLLVPLAFALAMTTACGGGLTRNHKEGLAVVGGVAVLMGGTLIADGWSCDQANWEGGSCTHDGGELRNGAIMIGAGGALLTWAIIQLSGDQPAVAETGPRTARKTASGK